MIQLRDIITHHPIISPEPVRTWAQAEISGQPTKLAQDNYTFYKCVQSSITDALKTKLAMHTADYTLPDGTVIGALYFAVLMSKVTKSGTRLTLARLRHKISHLSSLMTEHKSIIPDFNKAVRHIVQQIEARGENVDSLIVFLFEGFTSTQDPPFVRYIENIKNQYYLNTGFQNLTADELMSMAEAYYNMKDEEGSWGTPSEEQQQIVALSAEIKSLKNNKQQTTDKLKKLIKTAQRNNKTNNPRTPTDRPNNSKWAWKKTPPAEGDPQTKQFESKTYHWCINHNQGNGMWVLHDPADCNNADRNTPNEPPTETPAETPAANLESSMAAIYEALGDEDSK